MSATDVSSPTEALTVVSGAADAATREAEPVEQPSTPKEPRPAPAKPLKAPGRTTRVVLRRVDPWTVLKLSILYYLSLFLVVLVAGVLLWVGAASIGVIENIEGFMVDIGFDDFRFVPNVLLSGVALGGLVLVVAGTVANVIMAALFNLMGDLTGGLKLTFQEDGLPRPADRDATV